MSMARKMKRNYMKKIVGKCMKCEYAYTDIKKQRCDECQASREYIHFKRRKHR